MVSKILALLLAIVIGFIGSTVIGFIIFLMIYYGGANIGDEGYKHILRFSFLVCAVLGYRYSKLGIEKLLSKNKNK